MTTETNLEQAVRLLEQTRADLKTKVEQTQHDLAAVERSIQLLGLTGLAPMQISPSDSHALTQYASLRPQRAVELFFRETPQRPFKPSVIAKALRARGCKSPNPNPNVFVTQIRTACLRLTEKGVLEQIKVEGKTAFQLKKPKEIKDEGSR